MGKHKMSAETIAKFKAMQAKKKLRGRDLKLVDLCMAVDRLKEKDHKFATALNVFHLAALRYCGPSVENCFRAFLPHCQMRLVAGPGKSRAVAAFARGDVEAILTEIGLDVQKYRTEIHIPKRDREGLFDLHPVMPPLGVAMAQLRT